MTTKSAAIRPIRSYVTRSGRLTDSQRNAIENYWYSHVIEFRNELMELSAFFPQSSPITLEIGFGMGASLLKMAQQEPRRNFLGIDVHRPGIGKVLHEIVANDIRNLKLVCHDAKEFLEFGLSEKCLDRVLIFFPDPWPKKRHHKRRLIQTEFIDLLSSKLIKGGTLHLATDWSPYAESMLEILEANSCLRNKFGAGVYWEKPDRPSTKFEIRGKRLGHTIWDLLFIKTT
ncbi:MAG: tRNA (guanosine(46)-N7)-methyltransferase TrmB [Gammaproteobacteria bacterium]|nr:tRNA (guanosine(46)-N7)-methyltransferase TrmB [Gammaproteobacteria bacterium]